MIQLFIMITIFLTFCFLNFIEISASLCTWNVLIEITNQLGTGYSYFIMRVVLNIYVDQQNCKGGPYKL